MPQSRIVSATRETSWRTPVSRSGVPSGPCRYFEATMLVAVIDQSLGTSTSFCSKMELPCASVIEAVRFSHSTESYGLTPATVKKRRKVRPGALFFGLADVTGTASDLVVVLTFSLTSDILSPGLDVVTLGGDARAYLVVPLSQ